MEDYDRYIEKLKQCKPLSVPELEKLFKRVDWGQQAKEILTSEQNVPTVSAPVTVCGDIHGQFYDLMELFKICGEPPVALVDSQYTNFLFLGDYVDRGYNSIECFSLIIALKVRYKDRMTVLRGNHETSDANRLYGFFDECHKKYGNDRVWRLFTEVFNFLPLAALVAGTWTSLTPERCATCSGPTPTRTSQASTRHPGLLATSSAKTSQRHS